MELRGFLPRGGWCLVFSPALGYVQIGEVGCHEASRSTTELRGFLLRGSWCLVSSSIFGYAHTGEIGCHEDSRVGEPILMNVYAWLI